MAATVSVGHTLKRPSVSSAGGVDQAEALRDLGTFDGRERVAAAHA